MARGTSVVLPAVMRTWPLLLVSIPLSIMGVAPAAAAEGDHIGLEAYLGVAGSNAMRRDGTLEDEVAAQVGVTVTLTAGHAVFGLLVEATPGLFGASQSHAAAIAGGELRVARRARAQLLGELGVHRFSDLGASLLSEAPRDGETSAVLPYSGARLVGTVDAGRSFYLAATLVGRADWGRKDAQASGTWRLGGTELAAAIGGGWRF